MVEKLTNYQEGDYLIIRDEMEAEQYLSISEDLEKGMVIQVEHHRDNFLVCKKAKQSKRTMAKPFPPVTSGREYVSRR